MKFKEWYKEEAPKFKSCKHLAQAAWQHIESNMLDEYEDLTKWYAERLHKSYDDQDKVYTKLRTLSDTRLYLMIGLLVSVCFNAITTFMIVTMLN